MTKEGAPHVKLILHPECGVSQLWADTHKKKAKYFSKDLSNWRQF